MNKLQKQINDFLLGHPNSSTKRISSALSVVRYRVILEVAKMQWNQNIELTGYGAQTHEGRSSPLYAVKQTQSEALAS